MTFDSRSFDACPELCNGTQPTSSYLYTHTKNTNTVPYVCVCICVSAYIVLFESLRKSHKTPEHRVRKSDGVRERDSTNIDYYSVLFRKLIDPNQYRIVLVKLCWTYPAAKSLLNKHNNWPGHFFIEWIAYIYWSANYESATTHQRTQTTHSNSCKKVNSEMGKFHNHLICAM